MPNIKREQKEYKDLKRKMLDLAGEVQLLADNPHSKNVTSNPFNDEQKHTVAIVLAALKKEISAKGIKLHQAQEPNNLGELKHHLNNMLEVIKSCEQIKGSHSSSSFYQGKGNDPKGDADEHIHLLKP